MLLQHGEIINTSLATMATLLFNCLDWITLAKCSDALQTVRHNI